MHILITGGCGFMGSHFVRHIIKNYPDYHVTNLDKLTYAGNPENLRDIEAVERYRFIKGDIGDADLVNKICEEGVSCIVNFAAESHVDRSIHDPKAFIMTDVVGTHTLLETVQRHSVQKYIQISTDEVFGSIEKGAFSETDPFLPNSPYSASKAGGDLLCRAYHATYGTPVIVTHSANNYGPYQYPEKLMPLFMTNILEGKKVPVYGDGKNIREWIYVDDHSRAIDFILHHGLPGEVYNIGSGVNLTNIEITNRILSLLGEDETSIEYVPDRLGHDRRYAVDSSKLRALGWKPQYEFEQGIKETVHWYQQHEEWWKPLKSGEHLDYFKKQYGKTATVGNTE